MFSRRQETASSVTDVRVLVWMAWIQGIGLACRYVVGDGQMRRLRQLRQLQSPCRRWVADGGFSRLARAVLGAGNRSSQSRAHGSAGSILAQASVFVPAAAAR